jgi:1-acyl-sn-glycerol-3-phosphate acyltransferase
MSAPAAILRRRLWRTVFQLNGGLQVHGALPAGGCVVVANHASHADAPAILAAIDAAHRPVVAAAADYWFERPVKACVCRTFVAGFPVRRTGGGFADLAAHRDALAAGGAVVVFPAGSRRSVDGRFHQGAFRLAQQCGVPVVPVRLTGTTDVLASGGPPRRAPVRVDIAAPVQVTDPEVSAQRTQQLLAARSADRTTLAAPGLRVRLARLAGSRAGLGAAFCWALAEGVSWPVMAELLIAALVLSGPPRPLRTGLALACAAALGSAVGGFVTLLLARHGVLLPQPLTTPAMAGYADTHLRTSGLAGLWSQPRSGVPYKVYARAAGRDGMAVPAWFAASFLVRIVRMALVAALAALVQRVTRRWQRLYTKAVAAGLLAFVAGLCLVVTAWSGGTPS